MFVNGVTVVHQLTVPQISNIEIQLPPIEKQKEILAKIEKLEDKLEKCKLDLKRFKNQKDKVIENYLLG